jgi:hypothetical protein
LTISSVIFFASPNSIHAPRAGDAEDSLVVQAFDDLFRHFLRVAEQHPRAASRRRGR